MTLDEHKQAIRDALRAAEEDGLELSLSRGLTDEVGEALELYDPSDMNGVKVWGFGDE